MGRVLDTSEKSKAVGDVARLATAWSSNYVADLVKQTDWNEIAAMMAAFLTFLMVFDWFWKRIWRPLFESLGWMKPKAKRRIVEIEEDTAL